MNAITPAPETLKTAFYRWRQSSDMTMTLADVADEVDAAADAWKLDLDIHESFVEHHKATDEALLAAEAQMDRIANGIAVLGEENTALRKKLNAKLGQHYAEVCRLTKRIEGDRQARERAETRLDAAQGWAKALRVQTQLLFPWTPNCILPEAIMHNLGQLLAALVPMKEETMSNIDIFDDEIATASDDAIREWKAGLRHSDYPGIAHDIIGRIINEQSRRAALGQTEETPAPEIVEGMTPVERWMAGKKVSRPFEGVMLGGQRVCPECGVRPSEGHVTGCALTPKPQHYRPSLRQDGLYEIFLYQDDPAWDAAMQHLEARTFSVLSAGRSFVGRPEDYARFSAALDKILGTC